MEAGDLANDGKKLVSDLRSCLLRKVDAVILSDRDVHSDLLVLSLRAFKHKNRGSLSPLAEIWCFWMTTAIQALKEACG